MAVIPARSPIPLYHRVSSVLHQRVLDGVYSAGDRLAPEDELAAEFNVSRATIRQAVGELVNLGLLSRQQGRGTFVQETSQHAIGQVFHGSLADLLAETKRARFMDISIAHDEDLPTRVAESLELEEGRGTIVRRARTIDGRLFAYTINYLPPELGRLVTTRELKHGGLMHLLERRGVDIAAASQSIRAQLCDVHVAEQLGLELGAPVLFVERVLLDSDAAPVELVQTWYRGDMYVYQVHLDRRDGGVDLSQRFA